MALAVEYLYHAHLAGARDVRRTAGAAVDIADLNYAHILRQLKLAAVFEVCEFLSVREPYVHGNVGAVSFARCSMSMS